jgi:hypothetical protein
MEVIVRCSLGVTPPAIMPATQIGHKANEGQQSQIVHDWNQISWRGVLRNHRGRFNQRRTHTRPINNTDLERIRLAVGETLDRALGAG